MNSHSKHAMKMKGPEEITTHPINYNTMGHILLLKTTRVADASDLSEC